MTDNSAQCGRLIKKLGQQWQQSGLETDVGRAGRRCSWDIFSSHFPEFSGQFRQQCPLINRSSTFPSSHELISSISVSQHLILCREMDVASLGSGTLPPGTDRSHKIRRRTYLSLITKTKTQDSNTTARLTTSSKEWKMEGCQHTT